ncbi:MAG: hypothetical protein ABMB14_39120, partial [Myxococcota bacterium]
MSSFLLLACARPVATPAAVADAVSDAVAGTPAASPGVRSSTPTGSDRATVGATHTFLSVCGPAGRALCADSPGVDRARFHAEAKLPRVGDAAAPHAGGAQRVVEVARQGPSVEPVE